VNDISESAECVFCTPGDQPPVLFETQHFYVMPDKFPMVPGHTLIISKAHHRCLGDAPRAELLGLDAVAERARGFLDAAYGGRTLTWENGISGQSIFHAHLHLLPSVDAAFVPEDHAEVFPVEGWGAVRAYFEEHQRYRYLQLYGARYVLSAEAPVIDILREAVAASTGLAWDANHWLKATTPADVTDLVDRWRKWETNATAG
jgi:diadenosine tetraphosphate (Ap4A) HIT family hydrolase